MDKGTPLRRTVTFNYGFNPQITPYKQYVLGKMAGHWVGSSVRVGTLHNQPVFIADLTAGPGLDRWGNRGSPLIFAQHVAIARAKGAPLTFSCADRNRSCLKALRGNMREYHPSLEVDFFLRQRELLERIPEWAVGLTYWDTKGYWDLDHQLLTEFSRTHPRMDILLTRDTFAAKRMLGAEHTRANTLTLEEYLELLGKTKNYVLSYAHGWAFGFSSNWGDRPAIKMAMWYDLASQKGRDKFNEPSDGDGDMPPLQGGLPWAM